MYAKEEVEIGAKEYDESTSGVNMQDFEDIDISVELPTENNVQVRNSLGSEVEQILKKASKKLKNVVEDEEVKSTTSKIIPKEKEVDYDHMSTFMFSIQLADTSGIKIPNGIVKNILKFIDYLDNFHVEETAGKLADSAAVTFEIFDNKTGSEALDTDSKFSRKEKYLSIESKMLKALELQKEDIVRMMKKERGLYRLEIIRAGTDEHNIWANYCNVTLKGSTRKYGVI